MNLDDKKQFLNAVNGTMSQLETQFGDLTPILDVIAAIIDAEIDANFAARGRWDGDKSNIGLFSGGTQKWANLAPATIKRYKKFGYELRPTLERTGNLRRGIEIRPEGRASIIVTVAAENEDSENYGAMHQFGNAEKRIPARPFVTLTPDALQDILAVIQQFLFD